VLLLFAPITLSGDAGMALEKAGKIGRVRKSQLIADVTAG
jgi:hypothetical protein